MSRSLLDFVVRATKRDVYRREPDGEGQCRRDGIGKWTGLAARLARVVHRLSFTLLPAPDPERQALTEKAANKMWGGRFAQSPAEIMEEINASIGFDKRLAPQDIRGSKAHATMLAEAGHHHQDRRT